MNLQGIWNKNLRAVWSSNYTVNINTQMNYWPMLAGNLEELQEPLVRFMKEVAESGRITAEKLYGCKGWVSHHNIDLWRKTTPAGGPWKRICQRGINPYDYLEKRNIAGTFSKKYGFKRGCFKYLSVGISEKSKNSNT